MKQWLADEAEQKKPEFLKQRPKYFYYYEWMKERICESHPALPELVMDKLLTMPAGDLDLILQHPQATTWKVSSHVLDSSTKGPFPGLSSRLRTSCIKALMSMCLLGLSASLVPSRSKHQEGHMDLVCLLVKLIVF